MTFTGTANTGLTIRMDSEKDVGGDDDGFRPLELMLISLAGCTAMDALSILRKKRQEITAFEVKAHAEQTEEHPHVFTHIKVEYIVTGRNVDPAAVERSIELSAEKYCPAQAMMAKVVPIEHTFTIIEAELI